MANSRLDWERVRMEELSAANGTERFSIDKPVEVKHIGTFCTYCRSQIEEAKSDFIRQHWRICDAFKEDRQARAEAKEARQRAKAAKKRR